MRVRVASPKDLAAGALFVALAALFAALASGYELGTAFKMGPAYFPLLLAGLLALLGLVLVVRSLRLARGPRLDTIGAMPWRALALVVAGPVLFGVAIRGLGLVPTLVAVVLLSAAASPFSRWIEMALLAVGLGAFSWAVFIEGLGLPLPLIGPWLGGY
jgi:putative tricarboxylic transport membrane protein